MPLEKVLQHKPNNMENKNDPNLFNRILNRVARDFQIKLSKKVMPEEVKSFLEKLHPINPGKELIRIGPNKDGGYLLPDDLEGITACFSPGVDIESRFELDLAERGMEIYMADFSIEKPRIDHPKFHFTKKFLGADDLGSFMTLDTWSRRELPGDESADLLLQMDIEGFEYDVLLALSRLLLDRYRIIVIEFHQLDRMFDRYFFNQLNRIFNKLLANHSVIHIHPNNYVKPVKIKGIEIPECVEITLLRNDRFTSTEYFSNFPHPLDVKCTENEEVALPEFWYKK